jgi:hypothetical protein
MIGAPLAVSRELGEDHNAVGSNPVGFQNSAAAADLRFHAAGLYSLIRPVPCQNSMRGCDLVFY